jgi:hypothetical protein
MLRFQRRRILGPLLGAILGVTALTKNLEAQESDPGVSLSDFGKGYEQGWKKGYDEGYADKTMYGMDQWDEGWNAGISNSRSHIELLKLPETIVRGALFDFMGKLTSLEEPLTLGRDHTVYRLMDIFTEWEKERGMTPWGSADVQGWQDRLEDDRMLYGTGEETPFKSTLFGGHEIKPGDTLSWKNGFIDAEEITVAVPIPEKYS